MVECAWEMCVCVFFKRCWVFDLLVKQVRDLGVGSILFVCEVRRLNGEREINVRWYRAAHPLRRRRRCIICLVSTTTSIRPPFSAFEFITNGDARFAMPPSAKLAAWFWHPSINRTQSNYILYGSTMVLRIYMMLDGISRVYGVWLAEFYQENGMSLVTHICVWYAVIVTKTSIEGALVQIYQTYVCVCVMCEQSSRSICVWRRVFAGMRCRYCAIHVSLTSRARACGWIELNANNANSNR